MMTQAGLFLAYARVRAHTQTHTHTPQCERNQAPNGRGARGGVASLAQSINQFYSILRAYSMRWPLAHNHGAHWLARSLAHIKGGRNY